MKWSFLLKFISQKMAKELLNILHSTILRLLYSSNMSKTLTSYSLFLHVREL